MVYLQRALDNLWLELQRVNREIENLLQPHAGNVYLPARRARGSATGGAANGIPLKLRTPSFGAAVVSIAPFAVLP